jgi:hypothetical protein
MKAVKRVVGAAKTSPSAPKTEGLTPLDRDRSASVADEGGASAATVEAQPPTVPASAGTPPKEPGADLDETPPLGWRPKKK